MRRVVAVGAALVLVGGLAPVVSPVGVGAAVAADAAAMPFDFDGDGYADLAVGAPGEDLRGKRDAGAVQVFYGSASGPTARDQLWHQNRRGVKGGAEKGDRFGAAMASGDFDADGYADLAVGVPGEGVGTARAAGIVQVLYGGPRGLTARDQLWRQGKGGVPGSSETEDRFGAAVAAGDFDADGVDDLSIGVMGEQFSERPQAVSGKVMILQGSSAGLTASGVQTFSLLTAGMVHGGGDVLYGRFGAHLDAGDFNGDGLADLAVGAPSETGGLSSGAVHVLWGSATGVTIDSNLYLSAEAMGFTDPNSGIGELASGDINGDGRDDLVVGDSAIDSSREGLVAVLYAGRGGLAADQAQIWSFDRQLCPDCDLEDQDALAVGDLSGDGFADLAVGARGRHVLSGDDALLGGSVHILSGSAAGLVEPWTVITQDTKGIPGKAEKADAFGGSVAILPLAGEPNRWLAVGDHFEGFGSRKSAGRVVVIPGSVTGVVTGSARAWHQDKRGIKGTAELGDLFGAVVGPGRVN